MNITGTEQLLLETICNNTDKLNRGEITIQEANAQLKSFMNEMRETEHLAEKLNAMIRKRKKGEKDIHIQTH